MTLNQKKVKEALALLPKLQSHICELRDGYEAALRDLEEAMQMLKEAGNGWDSGRWPKAEKMLRTYFGVEA